MSDTISLIFIIIGVVFDLFGCIGLIRLPDVYNRLQSATKSVTLGTCSILFGIFIKYGFSAIGMKALIAIPLLFFASTVAAHALIRGSYKSGIKLWDKSVIDDYKDVQK
ncbi:MAG: monovalent cation/H(+) antiporter subunit G [Candidatus Tenebribacter mawsonii]|nr:monovalent cation/H(+) antiporter subunit G [Candidatus Tenebribacter mawsonii]